MPPEALAFLTVGQIAKRFGVETHRVVYVVRSRHVQPAGRAGIQRVFDEAAAAWIGSELRRIERDRAPGH